MAVDTTLLGASAGFLGSSAFVAAFTFGLRHGIDWDHIAALGDLTNGQPTPRRSLTLSTLHALGHAAVTALVALTITLFAAAYIAFMRQEIRA